MVFNVDAPVTVAPISVEGWLTIADACAVLQVSRQGLHYMLWDAHEFDFDTDVRRAGDRLYLLRATAVWIKKLERDAMAQTSGPGA